MNGLWVYRAAPYEWINDGRFAERIQEYTSLQDCADQDAACIERWSRQTGLIFDYLYIRKAQGNMNIQAILDIFLRQSAQYKVVYQSQQVDIFEWLSGK